MKKQIILSAIALTLFFSNCSKEESKTTTSTADNSLKVEQKNTSLINKFTGTNCYYCGDWGWTLMEDLIKNHASDAIVVGTYSQNSFAKLFVSKIATDWDKNIPVTQGYPTFSANLVDSWLLPVADAVDNNIEAGVTAHNQAAVVANTAHTSKIEGSNMVVNTTTQFFAEANGEYQIGVYVIENGVIGNQSGPNGGANASHHNVIRAGNGSWGEALATGAVAKDTKISKTTTIALDPTWKTADLSVFTVIWKKNGTKWAFVNAHK